MIDRGNSMGPHGGNRPPPYGACRGTARQDPIAAVPIDFPLALGVSRQETRLLLDPWLIMRDETDMPLGATRPKE